MGCCRTGPAFSLETSEGLTPGTQSRLEYITQTRGLTPLGSQRPPSYGKCVSWRLRSAPSRKPVNKLAIALVGNQQANDNHRLHGITRLGATDRLASALPGTLVLCTLLQSLSCEDLPEQSSPCQRCCPSIPGREKTSKVHTWLGCSGRPGDWLCTQVQFLPARRLAQLLTAGTGLFCVYTSSVRGWGHRRGRTGRPLVPGTSFGKSGFGDRRVQVSSPALERQRRELKTPAEQVSQGGHGEDITRPMPQAHHLESGEAGPFLGRNGWQVPRPSSSLGLPKTPAGVQYQQRHSPSEGLPSPACRQRNGDMRRAHRLRFCPASVS